MAVEVFKKKYFIIITLYWMVEGNKILSNDNRLSVMKCSIADGLKGNAMNCRNLS
jgi:hypothetical protein